MKHEIRDEDAATGEDDNLHFGIENRLSLGLEVRDNDAQLPGVLDEVFELGLEVREAGHGDRPLTAGRSRRRRLSAQEQEADDAATSVSPHPVR